MQWQRVATYRLAAALRSTDRRGEGMAKRSEAKEWQSMAEHGGAMLSSGTEKHRQARRRNGREKR